MNQLWDGLVVCDAKMQHFQNFQVYVDLEKYWDFLEAMEKTFKGLVFGFWIWESISINFSLKISTYVEILTILVSSQLFRWHLKKTTLATILRLKNAQKICSI